MNTQRLSLKRKLTYIAVASCFTVTPAFGNPTGGVVTHGGAIISVQRNTLTINNMPNSIINWQQFSIGAGEITRFIQQSGQSAVLNRVVGQDPSAILGQLLSNGRVFLINPNGVLFGAGSKVDVAGLVVSTLNMTDQDFINGKLKFAGGDNVGHIVNQGELTSATGDKIYLVAPQIENSGIITSPQGEIILAAGHSVNLVDAANPEIQVSIAAPTSEAVNIGQIVAQSGKVGLYASLISQKGVINANRALRDVNGEIILKAGNTLNLEAGSVTSAQGGGQIKAYANMQDGQVNVAGKLDASAPRNGDGGFIETSAAHVNVSNTAKVTTLATHGKQGNWLIDPLDFTVAAFGGNIDGVTLGGNLELGNVIITNPNGLGNGDIFVNDNVTWGAATTLTLTATRNVDINANITATNPDSVLNLNATNGMVNVNTASNSNNVTVSIGGDINVNARGMLVQGGSASGSGANTLFQSGHNITLTLGDGGLTVQGGTASGSSESGSGNANAEIHANNDININGSVTVSGGTADGRDDNASANSLISSGHNISITGSVAVRGGIATASESGSSARANANAEISSSNNITINGTVAVTGGSATATQNSSSWASADANANISGNDIIINGAVAVTGGSATANQFGNSSAGASANANISGNNITINGTVDITGGSATAMASGNSSANAYANARVRANNININTTGLISVAGGNATASTHNFAASPSAFASATASMTANTDIVITSGGLTVQGGRASDSQVNGAAITAFATAASSSSSFSSSKSANADAFLKAGSEIHITTSGTVHVNSGTTSGSGDNLADGYIETVSPDTIYLTFTSLNCCGVFINGAPADTLGAEAVGGSGFFADFSQAIFNSNYFVTYLGSNIPAPELLLYENGAVNANGVGEPLWTFLGNSLQLWRDPKDEFKKQECGAHV